MTASRATLRPPAAYAGGCGCCHEAFGGVGALRLRLSILMFLQWAVPGALVPLYSIRLESLGFDRLTTGVCCATQAVAAVVSSLVAGQVADRWLCAEKAMAVCAALAGLDLWLLAGLTEPVRDYVLGQPITQRFLTFLEEFLTFTVPAYVGEGKTRLTIAIGCTGGYHRSIAIGEALAAWLRGQDLGPVTIFHRELDRE